MKRVLLIGLLFTLAAGCVDLNLAPNLFPTGTSFVVSGGAAIIDSGGPCLVWVGDNGQTFHLFQDPRVTNDDFDLVTTPGVRSRLVVATRDDLFVDCLTGTVVEVQDVLEIIE